MRREELSGLPFKGVQPPGFMPFGPNGVPAIAGGGGPGAGLPTGRQTVDPKSFSFDPREVSADELDALVRTLGGDRYACLLDALIEKMCRCLEGKLRTTQLTAKAPGHISPPTRVKQMNTYAGVEDTAAVALPISAGAGVFTTVATLAARGKMVGNVYAFGHSLSNSFHWPVVEHRVTIGNEIVWQWFGQAATMEQPWKPEGWVIGRGETVIYAARNASAVAVNAMARLNAWAFSPKYWDGEDKGPNNYIADGG